MYEVIFGNLMPIGQIEIPEKAKLGIMEFFKDKGFFSNQVCG
jgi:hypothetical protein